MPIRSDDPTPSTRIETRLLALCDRYFEQYLGKIGSCVDLLGEDELWWRPNERSNSVGNLLQHLSGNLSQWVLAGVGGRSFERHRAAEFSERGGGRAELMARLSAVVSECRQVVGGMAGSGLLEPRLIQGQQTDALGAVLHAVEHMSYHTGQIVLIAKQLARERAEIEFYPHLKGT